MAHICMQSADIVDTPDMRAFVSYEVRGCAYRGWEIVGVPERDATFFCLYGRTESGDAEALYDFVCRDNALNALRLAEALRRSYSE